VRNFFVLVISVGALVCAVVAWQLISFVSQGPSRDRNPIIFEVAPGSSFKQVAERLVAQGIVTDEMKFRIYARVLGKTTGVRIGEYSLNKGMTPREVLRALTEGKSIDYAVTVPEGFNIFEIADMLNERWPGKGTEFFSIVTNPDMVQKLLGERYPSLEGYLFPDTYSITKYTKMDTLVKTMVEKFKVAATEANVNAPIKMPLHEQVILASVIEKETGAPEERPHIASVFHNRLNKKMRLESDPTIIYGMWVESRTRPKNIRKSDIKRATPYNTYAIRSLPYGPIANPSREALRAAVDPKQTEDLFFVSQNDGTHYFSKTYKEHEAAVRQYQLNAKAREGKSWRDLKNRNTSERAPKK
jgi:UPF0755 protein